MPVKSSEEELARKAEYYQKNKAKILEKKHARGSIAYENKRERELGSDSEWEKNQIRKMAKMETYAEKPDACELCGKKESELGYPLEGHEFDYADTKRVYLCKPCHAEADKYRRRS